MTTTRGRPPLPVFHTMGQALHSVPMNWTSVLRIFWVWGLILVGAFVLLVRSFPQLHEVPAANLLLLIVVGLLAFSSTAVAWHRLLLLGEHPPAIYVGIDEPVRRYLGRCLLIFLIVLPIMMLCALLVTTPLMMTLAPPHTPPSLGVVIALSVVGLVAGFPALVIMARLFVALPAIAIGRPMTLSESWQLTAGNTGQLFGGFLLVYAPSYAIGLAIQLTAEAPLGGLPALLLLFLVNLLVGVAAISFLSLSYRFLAGTGASSQPAAS